jgi:putative copper export protein
MLHVIAAIFWVGGMLFLSLVVVPFLKTIEDEKKRSQIYQVVGTKFRFWVGTKFRFWGWIAIAILLVTGPLNLYLIGIPPGVIFDPAFHGYGYGWTLMAKLGLVFIIVVSSLVHDFWLGPRARHSARYAKLAMYLGRSNLIIALIIVALAVFLRAGGI